MLLAINNGLSLNVLSQLLEYNFFRDFQEVTTDSNRSALSYIRKYLVSLSYVNLSAYIMRIYMLEARVQNSPYFSNNNFLILKTTIGHLIIQLLVQ
jgi:hypothetical protein